MKYRVIFTRRFRLYVNTYDTREKAYEFIRRYSYIRRVEYLKCIIMYGKIIDIIA